MIKFNLNFMIVPRTELGSHLHYVFQTSFCFAQDLIVMNSAYNDEIVSSISFSIDGTWWANLERYCCIVFWEVIGRLVKVCPCIDRPLVQRTVRSSCKEIPRYCSTCAKLLVTASTSNLVGKDYRIHAHIIVVAWPFIAIWSIRMFDDVERCSVRTVVSLHFV